ncbi:MAG: carboxy terminal-processing peptidase [Elusimicrobia bacterium]|nr:carboxy terminal-processing peptidase [Elusimicrobiota bacterium]
MRSLFFTLAVLGLVPAGTLAATAPDPAAGFVAELTARFLEARHYNRRIVLDTMSSNERGHHGDRLLNEAMSLHSRGQPLLNDAISTRTLGMFLDNLDYQHMVFEKADVDGFETLYAASLDDRIAGRDIQPAYDIFNRFLERLEEKTALTKKLTAQAHDFTKDEKLVLDRHEAPWPATPAENAELWRLRIKSELLQERLGKAVSTETVKGADPRHGRPGRFFRESIATSTDAVKNVDLRYERLLRSYKEFDSTDVLQLYLSSLAGVFDPHSEYMGPPSKETFDINMRLSLTGIGAVLRSEDGYAKIVSLVPGGPAETDKRLKPNDKIEAVAQGDEPFVDVVGMKLDKVVSMIRGPKGSTVRLRAIPNDAVDPATRVLVTIVRDEIKLKDQEAKAKTIEVPIGREPKGGVGRKAKLGVIDLPSFYADMKGGGDAKSTTRDVARLIVELKKQGAEGLILDLRRNGGGSLTEAINLTGLFIKEGPVVEVRDSVGSVNVLKDNDGELLYGGPLVVLTSRASASASEILAGALQDYRRAVIVGEKSTFGKGTVQSMIDLEEYMPPFFRTGKSGALKLTIQKFYRISGESTQNRGVIPDIHLPAVTDLMEITESSLKNALPFDSMKPSEYARLDSVTSALHSLKKASRARVSASQEFAWVREDMARFKKQKDDKTLSLNEMKRIREKEADNARTQKRKKERLALKEKPPEFKEITLDILDGVPPKPKDETPSVAKSTDMVKSTATAASGADAKALVVEGEDYEKAPTPDFVMDEALNILGDLITAIDRPGGVAGDLHGKPSVP